MELLFILSIGFFIAGFWMVREFRNDLAVVPTMRWSPLPYIAIIIMFVSAVIAGWEAVGMLLVDFWMHS